jgi:hypothetical protein
MDLLEAAKIKAAIDAGARKQITSFFKPKPAVVASSTSARERPERDRRETGERPERDRSETGERDRRERERSMTCDV